MDDRKARTQKFALQVIRLVASLPPGRTGEVIGRQLLRSGTSVGANYRAARRARSKVEFISRLGIVEEEADETVYWLELLEDAEILSAGKLAPYLNEAKELTAIFTSSRKTAKQSK